MYSIFSTLFFISFVFAQSIVTPTIASVSAIASVPIAIPIATAASSIASIPSAAAVPLPASTNSAVVDSPPPSDNTTAPETQPVACAPGISLGYMLIRQPNISSIMTVGKTYNISWDWSISVKTIPTYVDAYVQLVAPGVRVTWKQQIASKQSTNPRWFLWTPVGLIDGKYKLRLVPDGKETYDIAANLQPCFENGAAIPSVSADFSLSNPRGDLSNYRDQYPPNAATRSIVSMDMLFMLISTVLMF